jgi:hypothetical protein
MEGGRTEALSFRPSSGNLGRRPRHVMAPALERRATIREGTDRTTFVARLSEPASNKAAALPARSWMPERRGPLRPALTAPCPEPTSAARVMRGGQTRPSSSGELTPTHPGCPLREPHTE